MFNASQSTDGLTSCKGKILVLCCHYWNEFYYSPSSLSSQNLIAIVASMKVTPHFSRIGTQNDLLLLSSQSFLFLFEAEGMQGLDPVVEWSISHFFRIFWHHGQEWVQGVVPFLLGAPNAWDFEEVRCWPLHVWKDAPLHTQKALIVC